MNFLSRLAEKMRIWMNGRNGADQLGIASLLTADREVVKAILLWETALTYIVYIYRRGQIFAYVCNPFSTFLYLCSLELIPTSALVLSAKLF